MTRVRTVALGGRLEDVDQFHERDVEAVDGVVAAGQRIVEELVVRDALLVLRVLLGAVRQNHVVDPLEGGARHAGVFADDVDVLLECAFPGQLAVAFHVLQITDHGGDIEA
jgi:hypothetical protein